MVDSFLFIFIFQNHSKMIIRPALPSDAPQLAKLINMAMLEITYQFIGKEDAEEADLFMESLVRQKGNQYSYENIFVLQERDDILGQICIYDGARCTELRQKVWAKIKADYGRDYFAEKETEAGEMYLDTFAVLPSTRGRGLGKQLLNFAIVHFVEKQNKTLGLLVDKDNPNAKKLYLNMGFKVIEDKFIFGKEMEHMQYA